MSSRYAQERKRDGCGVYIETGQALSPTMECISETLKEPSMRIMTQMGAVEITLADMKGFRRLRYLGIDAAILMGA
ncbi:hypothetical protein CABS01_13195 [Colletotrichum abscissum]|uniref:Uncharacterized protein n=2 Tax=Colletotrichum acutatum species complex TaxID=2707335 RepID=A0A9P9XI13_9PEZI|nr:uncharacterized protein CCOS01_12446 [Colletotrichum costaricense]XP_060395161.1 uncharacterized protein CABS01_13195 [Colletotrichum abscissum]KAI3554109.1 hypothetical protein CABS02_05829 [Colletotrichum abscissum]KAK1486567.1 hypothetical protein CABS01_13195 [Colletotrichum abscissum]KAK1516897.1 hypothetical protein CCOS01_12446 [Colletotrichum costaricense]